MGECGVGSLDWGWGLSEVMNLGPAWLGEEGEMVSASSPARVLP